MDNFVILTYDESRTILNYLKTHLLTDVIAEDINDNDSRYLLSALLKLQGKYDAREK